jgi:hypothetical protein
LERTNDRCSESGNPETEKGKKRGTQIISETEVALRHEGATGGGAAGSVRGAETQAVQQRSASSAYEETQPRSEAAAQAGRGSASQAHSCQSRGADSTQAQEKHSEAPAEFTRRNYRNDIGPSGQSSTKEKKGSGKNT